MPRRQHTARRVVAAEPPRLLHRLGEQDRPSLGFVLDGRPVSALQGDTLLTAILVNAPALRLSEFGDGPRAGFCLMGACQDCWVWTEAGTRLRACSTPVEPGMRIVTREAPWPRLV
jgi:predicted molibdopterin-dependent oxidoreductase YjgC